MIIAFVPIYGMIALLPALVGLALGIVDTVLKHKKTLPKGMGIAGIALNCLALLVIVIWVGVMGVVASEGERYLTDWAEEMEEAAKEWEKASEEFRKGLEKAGKEWQKTAEEMERELQASDDD